MSYFWYSDQSFLEPLSWQRLLQLADLWISKEIHLKIYGVGFRIWKEWKSMLVFWEGAEVVKADPQLLERLDKQKLILLGSIHLQVYTIWMRQAYLTGFYCIDPYTCQMKVYQLSEEKWNQKIRWLCLYVLIQMAPIRFHVIWLEKVKSLYAV